MNIKLFTILSLAAFSMILSLKTRGINNPNRNPSACKGTGEVCNDSD
jgi:hypothetical protein